MNKEALDLTNELLKGFVYPPLKEVAFAWKEGKKTDKEYADALKDGLETIDELIEFAKSDRAKGLFGEEKAKDLEKHALDIKSKGAKYCDCPSCTKAYSILSILEKK